MTAARPRPEAMSVQALTPTWTPGPAEPRLLGAAVHVWRASLSTVEDELVGLLDGDERQRAARIGRERERLIWSRSRGVLRALLGRYLRTEPAALQIRSSPTGKPELCGAALHFNLSHSGEIALYALARSEPVGIDVQLATPAGSKRVRDHVALARRAFGEREADRLERLGPAAREQEFLRLWTRYEAELKRIGAGIGGGTAGGGESPWAQELDVGPGAAAALACGNAPSELRRWDWC